MDLFNDTLELTDEVGGPCDDGNAGLNDVLDGLDGLAQVALELTLEVQRDGIEVLNDDDG